LKLLFFLPSLSAGGAERVTATLANYWAQESRQITVVTTGDQTLDFYALGPGIKRIALQLDRDSGSTVAGMWNNVRRLVALRQVLEQELPDVAIGMTTTANCLLSLAALNLPIAVIGSERTYPPAMPLGRVWEAIRRWTYPSLDALVAQTEESASWLRERAPARKISIIPNPACFPIAICEPRVQPTRVKRETGASNLLLAAGRLGFEKGFDRLLTTFASIADRHPGWVLVILGEGDRRSELERLVSTLEIEERIRLPGTVGNIVEWYEAADLFVLTSRREGFPNVLLEALGSGLPVVAMECPAGPSAIVRDGVDGLLVADGDTGALARSLDCLMRSEGMRREYAERAVEVREIFSIEKISKLWEDLFRVVMQ